MEYLQSTILYTKDKSENIRTTSLNKYNQRLRNVLSAQRLRILQCSHLLLTHFLHSWQCFKPIPVTVRQIGQYEPLLKSTGVVSR